MGMDAVAPLAVYLFDNKEEAQTLLNLFTAMVDNGICHHIGGGQFASR